MTASAFPSINSTIVRSSTAWMASASMALMRAYFGVTSRLLPQIARRHAERLFTQPPRYAGRQSLTVPALRETVATCAHRLAVWQAGPATAPTVLLAHGWGGRGVQMARFVAPLLQRGFRVVWFDQPGHGESGSGPVALPDLSDALQALTATHGPFHAAIGHSLGAAAIGFALRGGLPMQRAVFIASPSSMREHMRNFARQLWITGGVREAVRARLEDRYGLPFADMDRIEELAQVRVPALFVHDHDDAQVPIAHALRLHAQMPAARLIRTHGLGHYRILRDQAVIRSVVGFVAGNEIDIPPELPTLPRPAPLY